MTFEMNGLRQFDPNASTAFARRNGIRKMDLSPSCRQSGRWRAWLFMNKCYGLTVGSEDCGPMPFVSGIERIHAVRYACSLRRPATTGPPVAPGVCKIYGKFRSKNFTKIG